MSERMESGLIGPEGRQARREQIQGLMEVVKGNRGWRKAFAQAYPVFNSLAGTNLLNLGQQGRSDDPTLLAALEEWIPEVIATQPEWYQKQNHLYPSLP